MFNKNELDLINKLLQDYINKQKYLINDDSKGNYRHIFRQNLAIAKSAKEKLGVKE